MTKFIDLSANNAHVDFEQVKKDGYAGVFLKATEGATYNDEAFHERYLEAHGAGLEVGAYCFARPETSSAVDEARHFVEVVNAAGGFVELKEIPGHLPGVLDMEDAGGHDATQVQAFVSEWLTEFESLTGHKGGLYTGLSFYEEYGLKSVVDSHGAFLWIADYAANDPSIKEALWQHTESAVVPGVSGHVDEDVLENGQTSQQPEVAKPAPSPTAGQYVVKSGDTLSLIALHTRVPADVLARFNGIENPNVITVGEVIHVPHSYRVVAGDTFWGISERFGVSVEILEDTNRINPQRLETGVLIWV